MVRRMAAGQRPGEGRSMSGRSPYPVEAGSPERFAVSLARALHSGRAAK